MTTEYGIDWKKIERRDATPHCTGMTFEEAQAFLVNDAHDNFKWSDIFVIVQREIGEWEPLPVQVTFSLAPLKVDKEHKSGCRCMRTSPPFVDTEISTDIIGGDCLPAAPNRCGNWGCDSTAGTNGYCGPNGCYNYP